MKMTFIECSECAGHGGEGIYCEECLSTGHIVVCGPAAEVIDQLRADLAAATARAETAEAALAAEPLEAIRRQCRHGNVAKAIKIGKYSSEQAMDDQDAIAQWLLSRGVQP